MLGINFLLGLQNTNNDDDGFLQTNSKIFHIREILF